MFNETKGKINEKNYLKTTKKKKFEKNELYFL